MITKSARDFKRSPDWERLEDDSYGAKLMGGGVGGITGALGGRTAYRWATDLPQVRTHVLNNPRSKLIQYGIPAFTGAIGSGIGSAVADRMVRGAHLSDRFTTGVGARLLGTAGKEQTRTDIPEMVAGASTVGAVGGASAYTIAKYLQDQSPKMKQYSKIVPKHMGKAALTAAGVSTANSLLTRGILEGNRGAKKFFDLENDRYLPEYKQNKKEIVKTGAEESNIKRNLVGAASATGLGLGTTYAWKKGYIPPEMKQKVVYNPKVGKMVVSGGLKGLGLLARALF